MLAPRWVHLSDGLSRFTLDRLVRIAQRLGLRVEITVRPERDGTLAA